MLVLVNAVRCGAVGRAREGRGAHFDAETGLVVAADGGVAFARGHGWRWVGTSVVDDRGRIGTAVEVRETVWWSWSDRWYGGGEQAK